MSYALNASHYLNQRMQLPRIELGSKELPARCKDMFVGGAVGREAPETKGNFVQGSRACEHTGG